MSNNGDDYEDDFDPVEGEALDDEQSGNDAADNMSDEEWDSYDEQQDDENLADEDQDMGEDAPPKKKSGLFNIVLIVVALLGVGGFIFMQMGKNTPPATPPAPVTDSAATTPTPAAEPAGMLGSPQEMAKLQEEMAKHSAAAQQPEPTSVTPAPTPVTSTPEPVAQQSPALAPVPTPVTPTAQLAPAPVTSASAETQNAKTPLMPTAMETPAPVAPEKPAIAVLDAPPVVVKTDDSATHMPKVQDIMLKSPAAPEVTPAPAPTPSGNADAAALNIRIDTLLTRIGSLEAEVASLKNKDDPADKIDSLKASVDTLEKKIDSLPTGTTTKAAPKKSVPAPVEEQSKPAPQILGATDDSQSAPLAAVRKAPVVKPVKVSTSWLLKGAQPGQAIVAKAGESDTRTVSIGDSLPSIGKITAIEYQNGRWAVIGTQGRINQ